jgi:Ni/Co efflux regulator RcnB
MRKLVLAALAAAALAAPILSAAASSASTITPVAATLMAQTDYKAVTHSAQHPDTTNYCDVGAVGGT